ncbi:ATP-binding protein [uncultured Dokdonia sp.]|uniref:ATP-binding protein n=1 Tax=uncultured Dokdonia sp. TaxID=575653 RepID=UPI0026190E80|nr:ATP-binding protein [uncultured Dokdonia sp.]
MIDTEIENTATTASVTPIFSFLKDYISYRLSLELTNEELPIPTLNLDDNTSILGQYIKEEALSLEEIICICLALAPHISPHFLSSIISEFLPNGGEFPEFGGIKGKNHRGILPTAETVVYILAGSDIDRRLEIITSLQLTNSLLQSNVLYIEQVPNGEPKLSGKLLIQEEALTKLTIGLEIKPTLSQNFPASLITTELSWDDLVLNDKTIQEIQEIETWLQFNDILLHDWNMKSKIKPGYRVMFYGPPGTGKTLTAGLLGKYTEKDVYRIDLSMVVSKYIGETEKNLSSLFDRAINKNWILFFDEADAIFGKRTNVRDAHDKYANQEVSYLLQRIEAHPGLVILASNFKNNIDTAFTRRFQSIIEFETPTHKERLQLWGNNLPNNITLEEAVSLESIARKFAITGSNIVNIIQYACLKTIAKGTTIITYDIILEGIKKEYIKEGKTLNV